MVEPIRILLVDIPTLSRRCLAALLNRRRGFRVVGEAATEPHALEQARRLAPDIALVEPAVPGGGPRLVAQLCRDTPCGAVLVLTLGGAAGAARRALEAGARGYLEKDCEPEELVRAIERVRAGDLIVAQAAADAVLRGLGDPAGGRRAAALTAREGEVLALVARGLSNPEIARELCVTEHTVKGHVAKILRKLGVDNRVQLAAYATQRGLAAPSPGAAAATAVGRG